MPSPSIHSFLGYKPDLDSPPFNSAKAGKNFVVHPHKAPQSRAGWIELSGGYAKKFSALPADDAVIKKISATSYENIYNLWIPEHGGQNVTILTATYTKTGYFPAFPTVNRFGIWIRPYWSGSAWVDAWRELTEMFIFELDGTTVTKLYLDNATASKYGFPTNDPTGTVFTADYFNNWTMVYEGFGDGANYDLVADSGYDGSQYFLQLLPGHSTLDFGTRVAGTKLLVYRSFLMQELPSTLASHIYGLLSEARITSGNNASDLSQMVGNRDCSFVITGTNAYTRSISGLIADCGTLAVWQYCAMVGIAGAYAATGVDVLPATTYYLRQSIVFDDGNEARLYDSVTAVAGVWTSGNSIVVGANQKIGIYIFRSPGALPRRARYLRIYMSNNNVDFYRVKDYDLRDATLWNGAGLHGAGILGDNHWFAGAPYSGAALANPTTLFITGTDFNTANPSAIAQRGSMLMSDTGVVQFSHAAVVGRKTYALGVRQGGTLYPNLIYATPSNGDGQPMFDSFGSIAEMNIDLEYNDGDALIAGHPIGDRLLAFKSKSVILVSYDTAAGFLRDAVTKADGLASAKTIADFEDVVYWAGYNGIYSWSGRGVQLINEDWLIEYKALSTGTKQAAVATFDRTNRQYRIAYASLEKCYDVDTGEWTTVDSGHQPTRFAVNQRDGTVDFLSGTLIQTLGAGTLHDGSNFTMEYEFNEFKAASEGGMNAILIAIKIRYASSVAIVAQLYADGVALGSTVSLAAASTELYVKAPLGSRCKRFGLKLTATTTAASQTVQIKEVNPIYQVIPSGVSVDV